MTKFGCDASLISLRTQFRGPAMCCVVELEDVIVRHFGIRYQEIASNDAIRCDSRLIFVVVLNFAQLRRIGGALAGLRRQGKIVVVYVFDAWLYHNRLNIYRRIQYILSPGFLHKQNYDLLCLPFRRAISDLQEHSHARLLHLPQGIDTTLCDGFRQDRSITFLAYGRQPSDLMERMSSEVNRPGSPHVLYHTDHLAIKEIRNYYAHRRMFWAVSERSLFSFAFDPYRPGPNPGSRFPFSIVGQRWFEAMSAGCVVVGRRPKCAEADQLFDWPDATLEIDDDPGVAIEQLNGWLEDRDRLLAIGRRNAIEVRRRHDWTARLDIMAPEIQDILGRYGAGASLRA